MPEYVGESFRIEATRGGWFPSTNEDLIPPEGMIDATNLNLHNGGRETRGGIEKVNGTVISGTPVVTGGIQFRLENGTTKIVVGCTDGKVYADYATLIHTFVATGQKINFNIFNNKLYIWNGANMPQSWDGAAGSTSDLVNVPADWAGSSFPKAAVVHGRGASQRIWAYGCPSNLKTIYISDTNTDDFSDANVVTIVVQTGDGFGVTALSEFSGNLVAYGQNRPYLIDDSNSDVSLWGYIPAQWEGGVSHERLLARTPNDMIAMQEDGEIYSVLRAQSSGDFEAQSIARPAHIHTWIKDNVDLSKIGDFHMIYDRELRAIRIFVVRKNNTIPDTCLTYFIDRPPQEAWTLHRYYQTEYISCSFVVRVSAGLWKIYTGGQLGFVWQLESTTITDNGNDFYNGFTTPELTFDNPRAEKRFDRNWLVVRKFGSEVIQENVFIDGVPVSGGFNLADENANEIVDESGNFIAGYEFDSYTFAFDSAVALIRAKRLQNIQHPLGKKGIRVQSEIFNSASGEKMFVSQIIYDHTPLGTQAVG